MERLKVIKTYKIYIGGRFPRTESGRYYQPLNSKGKKIGNICQSSRKDIRNSVVEARNAFSSWSERPKFNRGQILYRIAEMLEGRKSQFIDELIFQSLSKSNATKEVNRSIDRLIYYAGWCDKYSQVLDSVNPVATSHFNFSINEPTGVVGLIADQNTSLIGLISLLAPIIAGGNTCVVIASEKLPLSAITFAEVLNSSDVPAGVVNILTGFLDELIKPLTTHMDINSIAYSGNSKEIKKHLKESSAINLKRIHLYSRDWMKPVSQDLYLISDFQEVKTTWHPIENIGGSSSQY